MSNNPKVDPQANTLKNENPNGDNMLGTGTPGDSVQNFGDSKDSTITVNDQMRASSSTMGSSYEDAGIGNRNLSTITLNSQTPLTVTISPSQSRTRHSIYTKGAETSCTMAKQATPPFTLAGLAMVGAGILLDYFTKWSAYKKIPALVILTTPLLGLKGDLEMTLGARLSTQANLGHLDEKKLRNEICIANLCLDQHQANICSVVAVFMAVGVKVCYDREGLTGINILIMTASSILTGSIVSVLLGCIMTTVICCAKKHHLNPDNIASPIAGSLGDGVTITALSFIAQWFVMDAYKPSTYWFLYFVIVFYLGIVTPVCGYVAYKCKYTREALFNGWFPVIFSVALSTIGGVFLALALSSNDESGAALYQPLINGIGGNLVSVQASRIATYLHKYYERGVLPEGEAVCVTPQKVFFGNDHSAKSARLLLFLSVPGQLIFATVAHFINKYARGIEDVHFGLVFLIFFVAAAFLQVAILLYLAKILTSRCWKKHLDPDTESIPHLTAFGDLFGSAFLYSVFAIITPIPNKV